MFLGRRTPAIIFFRVGLGCLSLWGILCGFSLTGAAQDRQPKIANEGENAPSQAQKPTLPDGPQKTDPHSTGYVSGTVLDKAGAAAVGAQLRLTLGDQSQSQEVRSGANGQFFFANLSPGPFQLTIEAEGFEPQSVSGTVRAGEAYIVPVIRLAVATVMTEVRVGSTALTPVELAQVQIQEQEKQRVFGFIPNFFVSYVPYAVPLVPRQKFELAWKSSVDPFTFVGVAAIAGVQQATDDFPGYGQGMEGYAKRFGAAYADVLTGTFIGSAILPSVLKQTNGRSPTTCARLSRMVLVAWARFARSWVSASAVCAAWGNGGMPTNVAPIRRPPSRRGPRRGASRAYRPAPSRGGRPGA